MPSSVNSMEREIFIDTDRSRFGYSNTNRTIGELLLNEENIAVGWRA